MTTTEHTRPLHCPYCRRVHELSNGAPGTRPKPGDVSLCWGCGEVGIFTDDGIRRPTPEERAEILTDPQVKTARAAILVAVSPQEAAAVIWGSS